METSTMNASLNATSKGFPSSLFYLPYDAPLIALSILIVFINCLVIYMFCTRESLQTKTNSLLVSLAVSDLLNGLLCIPFSVMCNAFLNGNLCLTTNILYRFISISTMYHIFVVTLERYIYVLYPMKYIHIVTAARLFKLLLAIWLFAIIVSIIQTIWSPPGDAYFTARVDVKFLVQYALIYNSFCAVFCFLIPLAIMIISYTRMTIVIHRQIRGIHVHNFPRTTSGSPQRSPMATEARAIVIFATMLTIFTFAWTTWYITGIEIWLRSSVSVKIPMAVTDFFEFLRFSVSLLNPFLYTFLKKDFSRALMSMLKKRNFFGNDSDSSSLRPAQRRSRLQVAYKSSLVSRSSRTSTSFLEQGDVSNNNVNTTNGSVNRRESEPEIADVNEGRPVL